MNKLTKVCRCPKGKYYTYERKGRWYCYHCLKPLSKKRQAEKAAERAIMEL